MMMSFCKNTLHTFLGISPSTDTPPPPPPLPPPGLISITGDCRKPVNILESASLKPSPKKHSPSSVGGSPAEIINSGGGGGLSSCTESLGFESSEQMEETIHESARTSTKPKLVDCRNAREKLRCREGGAEDKELTFPPLLSSLRANEGHYSTSFLKSVRGKGRLILTPVKIDRAEVFVASRQDGRLRLQFTKLEKSKQKQDQKSVVVVNESGGELNKINPTERCQEMKRHHHHCYNRRSHLQQHWNQQCVTSQ